MCTFSKIDKSPKSLHPNVHILQYTRSLKVENFRLFLNLNFFVIEFKNDPIERLWLKTKQKNLLN